MLSKEYWAYQEKFAQLPPPGTPMEECDVDVAEILGLNKPVPQGVAVERAEIGGVPAEWAVPEGAPEGKVLVYIHGGGFQESPAGKYLKQPFTAVLAKVSGLRCVAPDYRLMPKHRFPDTINDCGAFYEGLLSLGYRGKDIGLIGESAGGNLVLSLWLWCKMYGVERPAGVASLSPAADLSGTERSIGDRLAPDRDLTAPLLSPRYGDFRGMERVFLQYGGQTLDAALRVPGLEMAEEMKKQGVEVIFDDWPELGHAFATEAGNYPEADEACARAVNFLKKELGLL